jgi:Rieske Fe-S protein
LADSDTASKKAAQVSRRSMLKWTGALTAAGVIGIGLGVGGDILIRPSTTSTKTTTITQPPQTITQPPQTITQTQPTTETQPPQTLTETTTATQTVTRTQPPQTVTQTQPAQTVTETTTQTEQQTSTTTQTTTQSTQPPTTSTTTQTTTQSTQPPTTSTTTQTTTQSTQPPTTSTTTSSSTSASALPSGAIANVNQLQTLTPVYFNYPTGLQRNILLKKADGTIIALSLLCTHQCCTVAFSTTNDDFTCPCHGSEYDGSGNVTRGPAELALPQVTLNIDSSGNIFPTGFSGSSPCLPQTSSTTTQT